jgi:hypothetical protein
VSGSQVQASQDDLEEFNRIEEEYEQAQWEAYFAAALEFCIPDTRQQAESVQNPVQNQVHLTTATESSPPQEVSAAGPSSEYHGHPEEDEQETMAVDDMEESVPVPRTWLDVILLYPDAIPEQATVAVDEMEESVPVPRLPARTWFDILLYPSRDTSSESHDGEKITRSRVTLLDVMNPKR